MDTLKEIEEAIPRLTRAEVEDIRAWIDDYLEGQMELDDDVKAKLDQSRREIVAGNYTTHHPNNQAVAVAQVCNLPYRRFAIGSA